MWCVIIFYVCGREMLLCYFVEFDYTSSCKLSRAEVIFYFIRKEKKGVFYELFQEFDKELSGEYDILPLVRPTAFDADKQRALARHNAESLNHVVAISNTLLRGFSQQGENQEMIARQGAERKDGVLYNPEAHRTAVAAVAAMCENESTTGKKRKATKELSDIADFELRALIAKNTVPELKEIARKEKIDIKGAKKKEDYAKRIHEERVRRMPPPASLPPPPPEV